MLPKEINKFGCKYRIISLLAVANIKLAIFELNEIKDTKKDDLKKKLRQSKTKKDIIATACEILS